MDAQPKDAPRLLVSGAWEYMRPDGNPGLAKTLVALSQAYQAMGYDVGLLPPREARALHEDNVPVGPWQKTAEEESYTVRETPGGRRIGFLRFPSLPEGASQPTAAMLEKLSRTIKRERDKVDLLIGLCDWGWVPENDYLKSDPQYVPDMLFGSGSGSGINGRLLGSGRCLWVRPYDKGRSLVEVNVLEWPKRENSFAWEEATNYTSASIGMNDEIKDNPDIDALFQ